MEIKMRVAEQLHKYVANAGKIWYMYLRGETTSLKITDSKGKTTVIF